MVKVLVYGEKSSPNTQRVLILLDELQLKYKLIPLNSTSSELIKLNPFNKIPVVKYDSRILTESRNILRYIVKTNDSGDSFNLYGDSVSNTEQWMEIESQEFYPLVSLLIDTVDIDTTEDKALMCELKELLDIYDKHLKDNEYLAGSKYTIADISHIPYIYLLLKSRYKEVLKEYTNVYNWIKRIIKRPAVRQVLSSSHHHHP